jgi:hypothetical protein
MLRGGPKISRNTIALRKPVGDLSNAAMSIFASRLTTSVCGEISYAPIALGDLVVRGVSTGIGGGGALCSGRGIFGSGRTSRRRIVVGTIPRGGVTGATGRGGTSVRGLTTGGGEEEVGRPSASRNLRICSSWESLRVSGGRAGGVDVDLGFLSRGGGRLLANAPGRNRKSSAMTANTQKGRAS